MVIWTVSGIFRTESSEILSIIGTVCRAPRGLKKCQKTGKFWKKKIMIKVMVAALDVEIWYVTESFEVVSLLVVSDFNRAAVSETGG